MGYASDLGTGTVTDICPITGYPRDKWGHLLQTTSLRDGAVIPGWDKPGTELPNFTSPYGHLEFCIGSDDDFFCFDYETIEAGPRGKFIILHSVINSESGGFIDGSEYAILPVNTRAEIAYAVRAAFGLVEQADDWCSSNGVKHSMKGWAQNHNYFPISVAKALWPYKFTDVPLELRKNNAKALAAAHRIGWPEKEDA